jgi:hypothetical protein
MGRPFGSFKSLRPFAEAREFVHTLNLSNSTAWWTWSKSGHRPADIPGNPRQYRQEFTDWYDWLGATRRGNQCSTERAQRRAERAAVDKKSKAEKIIEPADIQYQLAKFKREHPEWSGYISSGDTEAKGKSKSSVSAQPQKSAPKKCMCGFKLVWTTCKGSGTHSAVRGDSFRDRERAEAAAAHYKDCHGWTPFVAFCELCSAFHLYHSAPRGIKLHRNRHRSVRSWTRVNDSPGQPLFLYPL